MQGRLHQRGHAGQFHQTQDRTGLRPRDFPDLHAIRHHNHRLLVTGERAAIPETMEEQCEVDVRPPILRFMSSPFGSSFPLSRRPHSSIMNMGKGMSEGHIRPCRSTASEQFENPENRKLTRHLRSARENVSNGVQRHFKSETTDLSVVEYMLTILKSVTALFYVRP